MLQGTRLNELNGCSKSHRAAVGDLGMRSGGQQGVTAIKITPAPLARTEMRDPWRATIYCVYLMPVNRDTSSYGS